MHAAAMTALGVLCSLGVAFGLDAQTVRDSAGVRIFGHARATQPLGMWTISPQPLIEIEGDQIEGPGERVLGGHPPERGSRRRDVFDRNGRWVALVRTPVRLSPRHIGPDFVLGVNSDDDGVHRVSVSRRQRR